MLQETKPRTRNLCGLVYVFFAKGSLGSLLELLPVEEVISPNRPVQVALPSLTPNGLPLDLGQTACNRLGNQQTDGSFGEYDLFDMG